MSFFSKKKQTYVPRPKLCARCGLRLGTMETHPITPHVGGMMPSAKPAMWFCDECLQTIGRDKPRNT